MRLSPATDTGAQFAASPHPSPLLSVVIPVYNEEDRIGPCLAEVGTWVSTHPYRIEVILVDDGSTDRTVETARSIAGICPNLTIIEARHLGKANAVIAGLEASTGAFAGFCDVDLATPLSTWDACHTALSTGAGVAIASREGLDATRVGEPGYRHVMGRAFNLVIRALLLPGIHDTQCGFKFFTRDALDSILPRCRLYRHASEVSRPRVTAFDVELLTIARRQGFRIAVMPVTWQYGEHTKVNPVTDTLQNLGDVLKVRWNAWRGQYD